MLFAVDCTPIAVSAGVATSAAVLIVPTTAAPAALLSATVVAMPATAPPVPRTAAACAALADLAGAEADLGKRFAVFRRPRCAALRAFVRHHAKACRIQHNRTAVGGAAGRGAKQRFTPLVGRCHRVGDVDRAEVRPHAVAVRGHLLGRANVSAPFWSSAR